MRSRDYIFNLAFELVDGNGRITEVDLVDMITECANSELYTKVV